MIKDRFIAILLTIAMLASLIGGICGDVHADGHSASSHVAYCSAPPCDNGNASPSHPENDHPNDSHCEDCCSCSCHSYSHAGGIVIKHAPFVATLITYEPFTAIPEVVIPKFVPPENHA